MTRLEIPVPPGFTITTETCLKYLRDGTLDEKVWEEIVKGVKELEKVMGRKFGEGLLVSCRSGAKFSMPGMMDTVLNIGMNEEVVDGMIRDGEGGGDGMRRRFVWDLWRRLVGMFGGVVFGVKDEVFEGVIREVKKGKGVEKDEELGWEDWKVVVGKFLEVLERESGNVFPRDPWVQLRLCCEAVFKSWNGKRARDYRNAARISHDLGTAVNIQVMVFGNGGGTSATGVAMSRNSTTGEKKLEGDFLINAQGEDVVAGIRTTEPLSNLEKKMPEIYSEFAGIAKKLEDTAKDMQDLEFTVEEGKLWLLQTRNGKRTAQAAVRIAVDMVEEGLITKEDAVLRVTPEQIESFLHPQLDVGKTKSARKIARGLNVSPGAGVGRCVFDADLAVKWKEDNIQTIMVRTETKPDDVHGMISSRGIITARGGRTSHAALVARQFGKPAVVGIEALEIDMAAREMRIDDLVVKEGEWISIDGTHGIVYLGKIDTVVPDFNNPQIIQLLKWADNIRDMGVMANADYPRDAKKARKYGAQGIGLCRTEHMFFEKDRLPIVQRMIMASYKDEREKAISELLPHQRSDFEGLFKNMDGLPVTIRLLDPPLHEFLPSRFHLLKTLGELKLQLQHLSATGDIDSALSKIRAKQDFLERVEALQEQNPMLGTRGVRLGLLQEDISRMQVRAAAEAAIKCVREGCDVHLEIMIPLISHVNELIVERRVVEEEMELVMKEQNGGIKIPYKCGVMIETPRGCVTADEIATKADFFSFGSNDLTQCTYAMSRDDAENTFLVEYQRRKILLDNPFAILDPKGVGFLMQKTVNDGRRANQNLKIGICGEHGGEPRSIALCQDIGLDYVSCSPYRIPVARLAAAQATLKNPRRKSK